MKKIDKILDSIANVMAFLHDHMLWFLGVPMILDALLIGAYFAFGFENFILINSVFVVNFIGLGALALYVLWCAVVMPITIAIVDVADAVKAKKGKV